MDKQGRPIEKKQKTTEKQSTPKPQQKSSTPTVAQPKPSTPTVAQPKPNTASSVQLDFGNDVIEKNQRYFDFYLYFPIIVTIILAVCCFVGGIVLMSLELVAVGILVCWMGGGVVCTITYFLLKISMSYKVLHIYYLREICKK